MATEQQIEALKCVFAAAMEAAVLFPQAQACEAMVETRWNTTTSALQYRNLFGMKQHEHPIYGTVNLPTDEFKNGDWIQIHADFVNYPSIAACFADRMDTLRKMSTAIDPKTHSPEYPHYIAALAATNPEDFLTQVSRTWSTGPTRGASCIAILHAHEDLFV
jgi:flagellum-specific peptidoglycan hydrolase FlgJ